MQNALQEHERLKHKSRDGQLLWEFENGFELSPRESELLLETIRLYYNQPIEGDSGRVSLWVVSKDSQVGKPLSEIPKVKVWVTLDGGEEDLEVYRKYGHVGLRRQKLVRIVEEIIEQGGMATQQDLARTLNTSIRTIKRDIAYLREQNITVVTRGVYSDIGRCISHKVIIVELFLSGLVYTEICRRTQHSAKAVKRYVNSFIRVVSLKEHGIIAEEDIAQYTGLSIRLVSEYLELYTKVSTKPGCQARIQDLLSQLSSRTPYSDVETADSKKRDCSEVVQ
jgi:hypothetical protein